MSEVAGPLRGTYLGEKEVRNAKIIFMDTVENEGLNELLSLYRVLKIF